MEQNKYKCHFCPYWDEMNLKQMRKHNWEIHGDCHFLCKECVNVFKTEQQLAEHDRSQHGFEEEDTTVVCIHCPQPKQFKNAEALKIHSKSRHGHSEFQCGKCFNWFSVKRFRNIHRSNCK